MNYRPVNSLETTPLLPSPSQSRSTERTFTGVKECVVIRFWKANLPPTLPPILKQANRLQLLLDKYYPKGQAIAKTNGEGTPVRIELWVLNRFVFWIVRDFTIFLKL